jgi:SAM-dependent methyltransferase
MTGKTQLDIKGYSFSKVLAFSARGLSEYEKNLGIRVEDLKGKTILDIGSCYSQFQKECEDKHGIFIIALDPHYATPYRILANDPFDAFESLKDYLEVYENRKGKIAGINEVLPFVDNSFDVILSDDSSFYYSDTNYRNLKFRCEMVKQMFEEILRVLKPSGEAHIGEIRENINDQEFYEPLLRKLSRKYNSKFSWRFVTTNIPHYLVLYKEQNFD